MTASKRTPNEKRARERRGDKRDRLRDQAIAALLTCSSIRAAADECGVNESTLRRWLREPAFGAAYRAASASVLDGAIGRLQAGLVEASELEPQLVVEIRSVGRG
jgi:hypothetical protein